MTNEGEARAEQVPDRGVGAIVVAGVRVLLGHRRVEQRVRPNCWDLFRGHLERGEAPREALLRELREELCIDAELATEPDFELVSSAFTLQLWEVSSWAGEPANCDPNEHDEIRWFSYEEVASLNLAEAEYLTLLGPLLDGSRPVGRPRD